MLKAIDYKKFFEDFNQKAREPGDKTIMQTLGEYLKQEGMQQANRRNAKNMRLKGLSSEMIADITGLSRDEIEGL